MRKEDNLEHRFDGSDRLALADHLVEVLSKALNHTHQTSFSLRFWAFVLTPYVNTLTASFSFLSNSLNTGQPSLERFSCRKVSALERFRTWVIRVGRSFLSTGRMSSMKMILKEHNSLSIAFPRLVQVEKEIGARVPVYYPFLRTKVSGALRMRLREFLSADDSLFIRNSVLNIPQVYVEHFDSILDSIPLYHPEAKTFHLHGDMESSLYLRFLVALYAERGSQVYWYQHGGFYGEIVRHFAYHFESKLSDKFFTWGWRIGKNDVPWKAYRLEAFRLDYANVRSRTSYDCMLCFPLISSYNRTLIESATRYFFEKINRDKFGRILARPRPKSKIFSAKGDLLFLDDAVAVKSTGQRPMVREVKSSGLIIQMKHPSTNFLECLYVDHPCIALLMNSDPTDIVKRYYDFFLSVGVFHLNIATLVDHLNSADIDMWWAEVVRHPMYKSFKTEFLRAC